MSTSGTASPGAGTGAALFAYNAHNECIFDDVRYFPLLKGSTESVVKFDADNDTLINHATLKALVVQLTLPQVIDYNLVCDFFLTYRSFCNSHAVMALLLTRLVWALQYVNLPKHDDEQVGKLVLLRTFVVLRHWVLNYFVDDFLHDPLLCDTFASTLNQVTHELSLVQPHMLFERKVVADLKTHWLSQVGEFFRTDADAELPVPLVADLALKKMLQTTEALVHTNPSHRRLMMLSLYDKAHFKCLVYDAPAAPQLSISNLLAQHKSLRTSLNAKLLEYHKHRRPERRPLAPLLQHNRRNFSNIKDSSLALKRTVRPPQPAPAGPALGFATNGLVKMPAARVSSILPPTPVKKMEYTLREPPGPRGDDEFGRRKSLKKIVDGFKKPFNTEAAAAPAPAPAAPQPHAVADRVDVLSARIIDELEYMLRCFIDEQRDMIRENDKDLISAGEIDVRTPGNSRPLLAESELLMEQLPDLSIDRIDSLFNKKRDARESPKTSFRRAASINWHDDELNLEASSRLELAENSNLDSNLDSSLLLEPDVSNISRDVAGAVGPAPEPHHGNSCLDASFDAKLPSESALQRLVKSTTQYFDVAEHHPLELGGSNTSISTPSDIDVYNHDVSDLGIAMSPQLMKKTVTLQRVRQRLSRMLGDLVRDSARDSVRDSIFPDSRRSSARETTRELQKSYLSYDSAFSVLTNLHAHRGDANLRKKSGHYNLRNFADGEPDFAFPFRLKTRSMSNVLSAAVRKSIRMSNLCALTELPFSDLRSSGLSNVDHLFQELLRDASVRVRRTQRTASNASLRSVAIPGIDTHVLKELAAIPDETLQTNNPVNHALHKLEGQRKEFASDEFVDIVTPELRGHIPDDTEDILDAINNAATEDVIGYSLDVEQDLCERPITPIKVQRRTVLALTSTPHMNALLQGVHSERASPGFTSPRIVLDGYRLSSERLSVETVMRTKLHLLFVLSYDLRRLAEHFTLVERDMLQEIDWRELIELQWNQELTPVNSWLEIIVNESYHTGNKGVNLVIARFNLMVNWVISEILLTATEEERIAAMSRFIHIAHHLLALQNFATLMQIILALTSEKVARLKSTWNSLAPGDILTLKNLEEFALPVKNFINIRLCTNQVKPSRGCIPFVGLYLSDLVFNAERAKFVKPCDDLDHTAEALVQTLALDDERMINFSRFRTSVHIVKLLSQCIEWLLNYAFAVEEELLSKCLYIKSLDEEEMNYCLEA